MSNRTALVVMARRPEPGLVKTRLAATMGETAAAELYSAFLDDVIECGRRLRDQMDLFVAVTPSTAVDWFQHRWGESGVEVLPQIGSGLGERMVYVLDEVFGRGYAEVVMRNSDSPSLPPKRLLEARDALRRGAQVVLGPDRGGGYYLVALSERRVELFEGQAMGGDGVFRQTVQRAKRAGLNLVTLEGCLDIDRGEDLTALKDDLACGAVASSLCPRTHAALFPPAGA